MYKIGISGSCVELTVENLAKMSEAGISAVELSSSPVYQAEADYKALKVNADKYGITLWSCHLPFYPFEDFDVSTLDTATRKQIVQRHSELIKKAADVGVDKFVIHPSGEPIADGERAERLNCAMESLDILAEIAWKAGGVVAVEDLPRTCLGRNIDELCKLTSANDKLRVCFDTNHLLYDNNLDFIRVLGERIITLHISDYDFVDEKHWLPGEGKNDWNLIYNGLKNAGYNGVWMYELRLEAPKTISRPRDLTLKDIYNNAQAVFNGEKITPLGVPTGIKR